MTDDFDRPVLEADPAPTWPGGLLGTDRPENRSDTLTASAPTPAPDRREGLRVIVERMMSKFYKDGGAEPMRTSLDYEEVEAALFTLGEFYLAAIPAAADEGLQEGET